MFLWSILQKESTEAVKALYCVQRDIPMKNDWINLVKSDLQKLNISFNESEIKSFTKEKFKCIVKGKLET